MEFVKSGNEYLLRLYSGEEIVSSLQRFADENQIFSGRVSGIGAVSQAELGFFDQEAKVYQKKMFQSDYEILNLTGNFSLLDEKVFLHAHILLGDQFFQVFGGHLFSALISVTGEFFCTPFDRDIRRKFDEKAGVNLLNFHEKP